MTRPTHVITITLALGLIGLAGSSASWADRPDGRGGPPQEAIDACASGDEASACGFTSKRGDELVGDCQVKHDALVCVPEGHDQRRGERGPRESSEGSLE